MNTALLLFLFESHGKRHIYTFLEKSTVFEVIFDNDVCNGIEDKGDVVCVRGTCKVSVDLFCVLSLV
jgi:hypothetical protein